MQRLLLVFVLLLSASASLAEELQEPLSAMSVSERQEKKVEKAEIIDSDEKTPDRTISITTEVIQSEVSEGGTLDTTQELILDGSKWLVDTRDSLSDSFYDVATGLDGWMAGDGSEKLVKKDKSYIRVRLRSTQYKAGRRNDDAHIKMKLDLPRTKKRVKLFFESSEEETDPLIQKTLSTAATERQQDNRDSVAGLRFLSRESKNWKISNDFGVKSRLPLDPFWRFKAKRTWKLNDDWSGTFEDRMWYFDTKGYGNLTRVSFNRAITDTYSLSIMSQGQFEDRYNNWQFLHSLSTLHILNDSSNMAYSVGVIGNSKPSPKVNGYFISANYSKNLYKDWLFLEVRPEVTFSRFRNWEPAPALTIELDVYFTD